MNTLKAEKRSLDVKAKRLRREGYVVGNVFGREMKESIPVKMVKRERLCAAYGGNRAGIVCADAVAWRILRGSDSRE